jgi:hypothetical protein
MSDAGKTSEPSTSTTSAALEPSQSAAASPTTTLSVATPKLQATEARISAETVVPAEGPSATAQEVDPVIAAQVSSVCGIFISPRTRGITGYFRKW